MGRWIVALLTAVVLGAAAWVLYVAADPYRTPVAAVQLEGELRYLSHQSLARAVEEPSRVGFFRVDLAELRAALRALPWVKDARVRRVWPDRLRVVVRERVPAARWAAGGLVDVDGEIFRPPPQEYPRGLPELDGPEGTERVMLGRYRELQDWVAASGWRVERAGMDLRRAWWIDTDRGVRLVLGRDPGEAAVRRVARLLPALRSQTGEALAVVDLRYPNGFAVRWMAVAVPGAEAGEGHGKKDR
jgi:cell division protein FtsQ